MLSIVVPTYNNAEQLVLTINNIIKQNIRGLEIVVVDDNSIDLTEKIIINLQNNQIKYFKNSKNIGATLSRVWGIKQAQGDYIGFLDDDDFLFPNKFNKQLQKLQASSCDFVMCNYVVNNMIDQIKYSNSLEKYAKSFLYHIVRSPGPFMQCCLFKKEFLLQNINLFDPNSEPSEDWDFFISISKKGPIIKNINEVLFQWNLSRKSQSSNYEKETLANEYIINKHYTYILKNSSLKNMSSLFQKLGSMFFYIKYFNKSDKYFRKSIQINPCSVNAILLKILFYLPKNIRKKIMSPFVKKII